MDSMVSIKKVNKFLSANAVHFTEDKSLIIIVTSNFDELPSGKFINTILRHVKLCFLKSNL
jgi:hypothetical protein